MNEKRRKNEFKMHLDVARQYALVLPNEQDRIKALKWLLKIKNTDAKAKKTKRHALQLLILCLQRKQLIGPFQNVPEQDKELVEYELGSIQPVDVVGLILAKESENRKRLPVAIDVYGDTCEFVAYQEIPQFGAHFFYAYSPEPMKTWDNIDKSIIPHGLWNISITSSPDESVLAQTVKETAEQERQEQASEKKHEQDSRKEEEFTDASVLKSSGALKESFIEEEPAAKDIDTSLIGVSISSGIVQPSEVEATPEFKDAADVNRPQQETVAICTKGESNVKEKKKKSAQKEKSAKREKSVVDELPPTCGGADNWVETPVKPKRLRKRHTKGEGRAGVCQISPEEIDIDDETGREIRVEVVLSGSEDEMEEFDIEAEVICEDSEEGGELEDVCEDEGVAVLDDYCDPELIDDSLPLVDLDRIAGMDITERLNLANLLLQKQLQRYSKHSGRIGEWARDVLLEIRRRCELGPQPDEADYLERKLAEFACIRSQCIVPLREQQAQKPPSRECPSSNFNAPRTPSSYFTEPCAPSMPISSRQYLSVPSPQRTPPRGFSRTPEVILEDEEFPGEREQSIYENDECASQMITDPCAPSMQKSSRQYLSVPSPQRTPPRGFSRTPEVFLEEREQSIYENDECAPQMITEPCVPSLRTPSPGRPMQYVSPASALDEAVEMSKKQDILRNKYRALKGLSPLEEKSYKDEGFLMLERQAEVDSAYFRDDECPTKLQLDYTDEEEPDSTLYYTADDILADDEMICDLFEEGAIAEPAPIHTLPVPIQQTSELTPISRAAYDVLHHRCRELQGLAPSPIEAPTSEQLRISLPIPDIVIEETEEDECPLDQVPTPHISPQCTPPQRSPLHCSPPQRSPPQRTPPMQYLAPPPPSWVSGSPICPFSSPEDMTIPYTGPLLPHETGFRFLSNYTPSAEPIDPSLLPSPSMYNPCNVSGMSPQVLQTMETGEGVKQSPAQCTPHIGQRSPQRGPPQCSPPQRSPPQRSPPQRSPPNRNPPQCSPSQRTSPMQYLATPSPRIQPPTSANPICPFTTPEDMTIPYTGPLLPHETGFRFLSNYGPSAEPIDPSLLPSPSMYNPCNVSGMSPQVLQTMETGEGVGQTNDQGQECGLYAPASPGPSNRTPPHYNPPEYCPPYCTVPSGAIDEFLEDEECPEEIDQINDESEECELDVPSSQGPSHRTIPEECLEDMEFPEELDESDECVGRWMS